MGERIWRIISTIVGILMVASCGVNAQTTALSQQFKQSQLSTVTVTNERVHVIKRDSDTALTKGVAIILSEASLSGVGQQQVGGIADELASHGWVSLRVPVKAYQLKSDEGSSDEKREDNEQVAESVDEATPSRETSETTESPQTTDTADTADDANGAGTDTEKNPTTAPQQQPAKPLTAATIENVITESSFKNQGQYIRQLVKQVIPLTDEYPGFVMIIAEGTTAAWLSDLFAEQQLDVPDAVVLLSPFWPQTNLNSQVAQSLGAILTPVLMMDHFAQSYWASASLDDRVLAMTKARKLHFRHRYISLSKNNRLFNKELTYEIARWTQYMDW